MYLSLEFFQTGICDRLRAFTFTVAMAKINNDFTLNVYENASYECPDRIIDLFDVNGFELKSLSGRGECGPILMTPFNSFPCLDTVNLHLSPSLKYSPEQFLAEWLSSYRLLRPKPEFKSVQCALNSYYDLGVHIRCTDRLAKRPGNGVITRRQLTKFIYEYLPSKIESSENLNSVYLCSDSEDVLREAIDAIGERVPIAVNPLTRSKKGGRESDGVHFLYDLFSLSRAREVVSTVGGGVPMTANLISKSSCYQTVPGWTSNLLETRCFENLRLIRGKLFKIKRSFL